MGSAYYKSDYLHDAKTTQEGFLEVSKILGDPRTTNNPSAVSAYQSTDLTKDLYSSRWTRKAIQKKCQRSKVSLLISVISAPDHYVERQAIRQGWGLTAKKSAKVAIIFMVGLNDTLMPELKEESDQFNDLVITNHVDTYKNLTLKTLAAFDYMAAFCPQAEYLLKTDDDMFIQVKRLMAMVRGLGVGQKLIVGNVASSWSPVRNPESKYYISESQYPEAMYPAFVTGPSYLVSKNAVIELFKAAMEHPYIHLEDVFLTGVIAEQCDIPRRLAVEFRNNAVRIPAKFLGCTLLRTISIHKVLPSEQIQMASMAENPICGRNKV